MITQLHVEDWSSGDKSGLVSIGKHSLFLKVSGPTRKPGDPVVIIECGHSDFSDTWAAVQRCISPFARICTYDRAGYGHSEPSGLPRTAQNIAQELQSLLRAAKIEPPYVLVGHSYGGIFIREFLALLDVETMVTGMVLVDTNQEKTNIIDRLPMPQLIAVGGNLDRNTVIGLKDTHKLTPEEWDEAKALGRQESGRITGQREMEEILSNDLALTSKSQMKAHILGNKRLSVIKGNCARDMLMMYQAGVQAGNGTSEDRRVLKAFVDGLENLDMRLQIEQLSLSNDSRLIYGLGVDTRCIFNSQSS